MFSLFLNLICRTLIRKREVVKKSEIFDHYIRVAEMLDRMFAPMIEVLIHDASQPKHSIIAIYNGKITGRKVGDPNTDFGLKKIKGLISQDSHNHMNRSPDGNLLKSSSIAIRDTKGKMIGEFCVNMNVSYFDNMKILLDGLLTFEDNNNLAIENFHHFNNERDLKSEIKRILIDESLSVKILSKDDKKTILRIALEKGLQSKRRFIQTFADELQLTKPTLYKYIREIESIAKSKESVRPSETFS